MIYKVIERGKEQTYDGFGQYQLNSEYVAMVHTCGEVDFWSVDGTNLAIEELERFYRSTHGEDVIKITVYKLEENK